MRKVGDEYIEEETGKTYIITLIDSFTSEDGTITTTEIAIEKSVE